MSTKEQVRALRRLGSLNYRRSERLKEQHDPAARTYRQRAIGFYSEAGSLIAAWQASAASAGAAS